MWSHQTSNFNEKLLLGGLSLCNTQADNTKLIKELSAKRVSILLVFICHPGKAGGSSVDARKAASRRDEKIKPRGQATPTSPSIYEREFFPLHSTPQTQTWISNQLSLENH